MIEKIYIKNAATFDSTPEELVDLARINFIYGSNGTGKTTVSRVIADDSVFPDCRITWKNGIRLKTLVYNRDFIESNFNQTAQLKGIFTLGKKNKETLDKIKIAKEELDSIVVAISHLRINLEGDGPNSGEKGKLKINEERFTDQCWILKQKYDTKFKEAFTGYRASRNEFKNKLIGESQNNSANLVPLDELENKAKTIFDDTPQLEDILEIPQWGNLHTHESNLILKKKVIGKSDVDIAAMIEKLGSSDWVKEGRKYYNPEEQICPFCQQQTNASLEKSLNEFFDETFEADSAKIDKLYEDYKADSKQLLEYLNKIISSSSKFMNNEQLRTERDLLESKVRLNLQKIEKKSQKPSRQIELKSLKGNLESIEALLNQANIEISKHNTVVNNFCDEKLRLIEQVWRFLLDHEIKENLANYNKEKEKIAGVVTRLESEIKSKKEKEGEKEDEIRSLEMSMTSIQPTINNINIFLKSFGFKGFVLTKSSRDGFYKIQRPDGADVKETLSDGEKSFIAFLYFYHLLKGSETGKGITLDRVAVFDDPVSSLDSDILFVVSSLIKKLFDAIRQNSGIVKQVFVLTHNVFFHKEVSFNSRRTADKRLQDETFWMVRKFNQMSKLEKHDSNPIKTSYELLWNEVRTQNRDNFAVQNNLRRILEYYFKILGSVDLDDICNKLQGEERQICKSLFSWVHDGSHSVYDSLYISIDDSVVNKYLNVFKRIFEETGHYAHYKMMMGIEPSESENETSDSVAA